jgi:hypothetical protein
MIIKNNRIIIYDKDIQSPINPKEIKGARYYQKDKKWSIPVEEMSKLVSKRVEFEIEQEWFEIFPNFKFLSRL